MRLSLMRYVLALLLLLGAAPVAAEPMPFRWPAHREVPSRLSDALLAGQMAAGLQQAVAEDAVGCWAARTALAAGVTEVLKRAVRRRRPDGSDRKSMPSMHAALAAVNMRRSGWSIGLTAGVSWGRNAAGVHWPSDLLSGVAIGVAAQQVCGD